MALILHNNSASFESSHTVSCLTAGFLPRGGGAEGGAGERVRTVKVEQMKVREALTPLRWELQVSCTAYAANSFIFYSNMFLLICDSYTSIYQVMDFKTDNVAATLPAQHSTVYNTVYYY